MHCIFCLNIVYHYSCISGERAPTLKRGRAIMSLLTPLYFGKIEKVEFLAWMQRIFTLEGGKTSLCFEDHLLFCLSVLGA